MTEKKVIDYTKEEDGVKAEFEITDGIVKAVWIDNDIRNFGSEDEFDKHIAALKDKISAYEKTKEFFMEVLEEVKNERS